jgi:hypothetical protein
MKTDYIYDNSLAQFAHYPITVASSDVPYVVTYLLVVRLVCVECCARSVTAAYHLVELRGMLSMQ